MKLEDKYRLLKNYLVSIQEILNLQPKGTIVPAQTNMFSTVELLQLFDKEHFIELLDYYTYEHSELVHVLPFFNAIIDELVSSVECHPFCRNNK